MQRWRIGTDGRRDGEIEEGRTTWLQLQGHASFPVSAVTVTPDTVELPLGTVDALRYAVDDGGGGGTDRTTMVSDELP